jgi:demethylmenaquinone methyltransferase/2-methoxy-6-polyprenyl-1,4-benzoquinol methylase
MEAYTKKLDQSFVMREPAIRSAIRRLQFAPNSHGLDIGCGIGNITGILAEYIAPRGRVTGVDISPGMVAYARDAAEKAGLTKQYLFVWEI